MSKFMVPPGRDISGFKGYCWDVLRESYHEMGYTIQLTVTPWARAMVNFKSGKADILFPTGKNSERLKIFNYSQEPTNEANFVIYVRADTVLDWKGLDGLKGLAIGVKRDFNYGDRWKQAAGFEKYSVTEISQGFKMLDARRIDGFLGYEYNWDYYLKQKKISGLFKKLPSVGRSAEYPAALKTNPKGQALLDLFDTGKRRLIETGRLAEIKQAWFGE
ncbi:MAG: transporter substrate-binding domain-containing protein [Desulfobacterales bacterium]|nr:transporter substrate-binding domain-containing protein [Desulfobacterales bacterium]